MQTQPNPEIRHCRITSSATTQSCPVPTGQAPTVLPRPKTPPSSEALPLSHCDTIWPASTNVTNVTNDTEV